MTHLPDFKASLQALISSPSISSTQASWDQGNKAIISWTSWGQNIDYYELQRSSDNTTFESINSVQGQITATEQSFVLTDFGIDDVYYRLKIVGKQ